MTPELVRTKQFRIAFRGYAVDEVDEFLDELQAHLVRLSTEHVPAGPPVPAAGGGDGAPRAAEPVPRRTADAEIPDGPSEDRSAHAGTALRTLRMAEEIAARLTAEATAEAERTRADANRQAATHLAEAETEGRQLVAQATARAGDALLRSREEAAALLDAARTEAARVEADAQQRRREVLAEAERLRTDVADLQAVGRDTEQRLRGLLLVQLEALDGARARFGPHDRGPRPETASATRDQAPPPSLRALPA